MVLILTPQFLQCGAQMLAQSINENSGFNAREARAKNSHFHYTLVNISTILDIIQQKNDKNRVEPSGL
jgi:oligoribonuclease (3'-5' exoribonuclease)